MNERIAIVRAGKGGGIYAYMGIYLNPGNRGFWESVRSEIYVDKTGLIAEKNKCVCTEQKFLCASRPRRFGKSMAQYPRPKRCFHAWRPGWPEPGKHYSVSLFSGYILTGWRSRWHPGDSAMPHPGSAGRCFSGSG